MAKAKPQFHAGPDWQTGQKYFSIEDAMKVAGCDSQAGPGTKHGVVK